MDRLLGLRVQGFAVKVGTGTGNDTGTGNGTGTGTGTGTGVLTALQIAVVERRLHYR